MTKSGDKSVGAGAKCLNLHGRWIFLFKGRASVVSSKRKVVKRGVSKVNVFSRLRESIYDVVVTLKYPVLLALISLEGITVLVAAVIAMTTTASYGLMEGYATGIGIWCAMNSPIIYKTWRKIKEEDDELHRKVMSEGWEGKKTTSELVDEYEELLEKK